MVVCGVCGSECDTSESSECWNCGVSVGAETVSVHRDDVSAMMSECDAASEVYGLLAKMADYFAVETAAVSCAFTGDSLGSTLFHELAATKAVVAR